MSGAKVRADVLYGNGNVNVCVPDVPKVLLHWTYPPHLTLSRERLFFLFITGNLSLFKLFLRADFSFFFL